MKDSSLQITYSQDLDALASLWIERCFAPSQSPFAKRFVIVPHLAMKEFLLQSMLLSPRLEVAMGCTFLPLQQGVLELSTSLSKKRILTPFEMTILLQEILLQEGGIPHDPSIDEYVQTLLCSPRKLFQFCEEISKVFIEYGLYGDHFLEGWLQKEGWQQYLWKRVHKVFSYPLELVIPIVTENLDLGPGQNPGDGRSNSCLYLHTGDDAIVPSAGVFAPVRNQIFNDDRYNGRGENLGNVSLFGFSTLPLAYLQFFKDRKASCYFFSPCAEFWADSLSRFEKKGVQILAKRLGVSLQTKESLQGSFEQDHPFLANFGRLGREFTKELETLLVIDDENYTLPSSFSFLGKVQQSILTNTKGVFPSDPSIQIHSAPSKLQEVEILHQQLASFVQTKGMGAHEIVVIATDLTSYTPFIESVFDQAETPYKIEGKKELSLEENSFFHLLNWPSLQFSYKHLKKIFASSSLQKRWDLSFKEIEELCDHFSEAGIERDLASHEHSWQSGLDRLLFSLFLTPSKTDSSVTIGIEPLHKFLEWFSCVQKEWLQQQEKRGMGEWCKLFLQVFENHFPNSEECALVQGMKKLLKRVPFAQDPLFCFENALLLIRSLAGRDEGGSAIDRILFVSANTLEIPPAKIIAYLGADEELLPRIVPGIDLSEMGSSWIPSLIDRQRYLFLEAVMKAKEALIFTYERICQEEGKEKRGSLFLQELADLAEGGEIPIIHHSLPIGSLQEKIVPFFDAPVSLKKGGVIDLHSLTLFAKSPIKFYLRESLGIVPPFSEDEMARSFLLPSWEKREFLSKRLPLEKLQAEGKLPKGHFAKVARLELQEGLDTFYETLGRFYIKEVKEISLIKGLREEKEVGKRPSLQIGPFVLEGILSGICEQGLIMQGKLDLEGAAQIFPLYLIYLHLYPETPFLISLASQEKIHLPVKKEALLSYLEFYQEGSSSFCPFVPASLPYFFKNDVTGFCEFVMKSQDPSLIYLKRHRQEEFLKEQFVLFQPLIERIYAPLKEASL